MAKFLSSAKEAAQADQWEDCVDNANRILKNEPDVQNIRFHAYDRYKKIIIFEKNLATKFLFLVQNLVPPHGFKIIFVLWEMFLRGFLLPTGPFRENV